MAAIEDVLRMTPGNEMVSLVSVDSDVMNMAEVNQNDEEKGLELNKSPKTEKKNNDDRMSLMMQHNVEIPRRTSEPKRLEKQDTLR